ncbi:hypothetical protein Sjap_004355 [Stephania japonica]|uniref:NAC domain-containing protein n=1 Tax=Stephania japonica TaxID=461633 RepID=A0AAP0K496_9MAGN
MGGASLPPGFRFHPTDEELIGYYLKRKVEGLKIELEVIPVIDLYKFDPWELPDKSFLPKRDMEWFFFCPRDRKYPNGSRTNRATRAGYWKATGKDKKIVCQSDVTGLRKTLVFYRGRAPLGYRTEWVMHEYRLCDDQTQGPSGFQGGFALCRVVQKTENGSKTGDSQGESKSKMVGSSSSVASSEPTTYQSDLLMSTPIGSPSRASNAYNGSSNSSPITSPYEASRMGELEPTFNGTTLSSHYVSSDLILDTSKEYQQRRNESFESLPSYGFSHSINPWERNDSSRFSQDPSNINFGGEVDQVNDFGQVGYMSPINYMGFYGDSTYQNFEESDSMSNLNLSSNGADLYSTFYNGDNF